MKSAQIYNLDNNSGSRQISAHISSDAIALGGGGPPDMTDRMDKIEKRLDGIESEQRTHFRWILGLFITLAALILSSVSLLMGRIDRTEDKLGRLETAVSAIPSQVNQNLLQLTQTLSQVILAAQRPSASQVPSVSGETK